MYVDYLDYVNHFIGTETPFMLLFVSLFWYFMKTNREREKHLNQIIEDKISKVEEEMQVLIRVWKILLEKELKK
jgi:hypothetical protein